MKKCFHDLSILDALAHPIWRFTNANPDDELEIVPVLRRSFTDLSGLIIASQVKFADSTRHLALHQNVSFDGPEINDHFLSMTFAREGSWFPLARYHDIQIETYGPANLAEFMDKPVDDIFPIKYDLRAVLRSNSPQLVGIVREVPLSPLTESEIISLALRPR